VEGDEAQLQQVILNLVMNSIDAMRAAGSRLLKIKSELSGPNVVRVSIEDT
jgi:signal transduction histidine kinase